MQDNTIIQAVIELIDAFLEYQTPFDQLMAKFFREHRYIGSSDRRNIAEFAYDILRNFEKIKFINQKITNDHARFIVITSLLVLRGYTKQKVDALFNGRIHSPARLTQFENKFIDYVVSTKHQFPENAVLNYPLWLRDRLVKAFPNALEQELLALNRKAPIDIRVNTLKTDVQSVVKNLKKDGFDVQRAKVSPMGLRILHQRITHANKMIADGYVEIQDEGSQIVALECGVHAGDTVVDLCAGAGGKTLALAALMENKGRIYATDVSESKLENAKLRLRKAGGANVYSNLLTSKWAKRHEQIADVVLVDAPCSGSGTWRRNPDMRFRLSEETICELTAKQREILNIAKNLVKVGGRLVYATCSIFCDENEDQMNWFLENHPNFILDRSIVVKESQDFIKMSPYKTDTDGFFCVKFIRQL